MSWCTSFVPFAALLLLAAIFMVRGGGGGGGGRFGADLLMEDPETEVAVDGATEDFISADDVGFGGDL